MWLKQDESATETERREQIENKNKKHGGESVSSPTPSTSDVDAAGSEKPGQAGPK